MLNVWARMGLGSALVLAFGMVAAAADAPVNKAQAVDLFDAIKKGDVEVKLIPFDATQCNVIFKNNTKQPILLKLPDAFAGRPVNGAAVKPAAEEEVAPAAGPRAIRGKKPLSLMLPEGFAGMPVLGQIGGVNGGNNGGNNGGGNQAFGGGMGGMGGMGGGGFGGGFMNVGPEKTMKVKLTTVCLQHGKADPNPRVPYEIVPISAVTDKKDVHEMCKMLGKGEIDQNTAQAAAWHMMDGLSWNTLASKPRVKHLNGAMEPWFQPEELARAAMIVAESQRRVGAPAKSGPNLGETRTSVQP